MYNIIVVYSSDISSHLFLIVPIAASHLDLPSLRSHVIPTVAAKWNKFGVYLGVEYAVIEIIKNDHRSKCEVCCEEMLKRWLAQDEGTGDRPRNWSTVIDVLEESELREEARELKQRLTDS